MALCSPLVEGELGCLWFHSLLLLAHLPKATRFSLHLPFVATIADVTQSGNWLADQARSWINDRLGVGPLHSFLDRNQCLKRIWLQAHIYIVSVLTGTVEASVQCIVEVVEEVWIS